MEFQSTPVPISELPVGTVGISESDQEEGVPNPHYYIVGEKASCGRVNLIKWNIHAKGKKAREEITITGGFRICPQIK